MTKTVDYSIGDVVRTSCQHRLVRITERKEDIKRGRPGFNGVEVHENGRQVDPTHDGKMNGAWGYDDEILEVVKLREMGDFERLLRDIVDTYRRGNTRDFTPRQFEIEMTANIQKAAAALRSIDSCKAEDELGRKCNDPGVRTVRGLFCCHDHAGMRERS